MNIQKVWALLEDQKLAVLCTQGEQGPYCSLMAYVTDHETASLFMVTEIQSVKYQNLRKRPEVSLLVDNRDSSHVRESPTITALTVQGVAQKMDQSADKEIRIRLGHRFPEIQPLLKKPQSVVIQILLRDYLLLAGPEQAVSGSFGKRDGS